MAHHERALSDTVAKLLIIFLIILVTLLIIASLSGVLTKFLQKPALIAVMADEIDTSYGSEIIRLYHKQGDTVNLNGTSQTYGSSEITILISQGTGSPQRLTNLTPIQSSGWKPGDFLFIYRDGTGVYGYTDSMPSAAPTLTPGNYTIQIIDSRANILLHTLPVKID